MMLTTIALLFLASMVNGTPTALAGGDAPLVLPDDFNEMRQVISQVDYDGSIQRRLEREQLERNKKKTCFGKACDWFSRNRW
eukprot:Pgem_evm1s10527